MDKNTVVPPNGTEGTAPEADKVEGEETVESLKAKLAEKDAEIVKKGELADNYKIRAEKAEKANKKPEVPEVKGDLTTKDVFVLTNAKVHIDDIESVQKFAKMEGISIADALKNEDLKAVLDRRANVRKSAEVSNTQPGRRTATKVDDNALLNKLSKGEVPEKGSEEAERLFWARRGGKRT